MKIEMQPVKKQKSNLANKGTIYESDHMYNLYSFMSYQLLTSYSNCYNYIIILVRYWTLKLSMKDRIAKEMSDQSNKEDEYLKIH